MIVCPGSKRFNRTNDHCKKNPPDCVFPGRYWHRSAMEDDMTELIGRTMVEYFAGAVDFF